MTILINRSFIHLITLKNPSVNTPVKLITNVINCKQDPFTYIAIKRYTFKKFYNVIIDISASKKSITSYRQYLAYKTTTNDNININTI
jgi:hypothetical protein